MKKKFSIIFILISLLLIGLFIYPSIRSEGEDCTAGCSENLGYPFPYSIISYGAHERPPQHKFLMDQLVYDLLIWIATAFISTKIIFFVQNLLIRKNSPDSEISSSVKDKKVQ